MTNISINSGSERSFIQDTVHLALLHETDGEMETGYMNELKYVPLNYECGGVDRHALDQLCLDNRKGLANRKVTPRDATGSTDNQVAGNQSCPHSPINQSTGMSLMVLHI